MGDRTREWAHYRAWRLYHSCAIAGWVAHLFAVENLIVLRLRVRDSKIL
jgi:hypothetical protein